MGINLLLTNRGEYRKDFIQKEQIFFHKLLKRIKRIGRKWNSLKNQKDQAQWYVVHNFFRISSFQSV